MTKDIFELITKWQDDVFKRANALTAAHHLKEEVEELIGDLENYKTPRMEYADCFLLLFGSAHKHGLTYDDILNIILEKFDIIQGRVWGEPNEKGYVKHTSDSLTTDK